MTTQKDKKSTITRSAAASKKKVSPKKEALPKKMASVPMHRIKHYTMKISDTS